MRRVKAGWPCKMMWPDLANDKDWGRTSAAAPSAAPCCCGADARRVAARTPPLRKACGFGARGKVWMQGAGCFLSAEMFIFRRDNKRRETGIVQVSKMENCDWCSLSEEEKRFQLCESAYWSVFLADEQDYVGRCILVLKRHCASMTELTEDEWEDLRRLICKVETCLKTVLGATLCNWSCLMNSFYKESEPDPHLHIHVRPRYDKPVIVNGNAYIDSEFGHHYAMNKSRSIPAEDKEEVFARLKEWLNC